jgi:hypothetical protein
MRRGTHTRETSCYMADDNNDDIAKARSANPFSAFIRYEKGARSPGAEADNKESYGEYLFGTNYEDTSDDQIKKANWTSYTANRMLVRVFSRGIMGASFYALGQAAIRRQMPGYHPDLPLQISDIVHYPLRVIARGFDTIAAPPIKAFVRWVPLPNQAIDKVRLAEDIVRFRPKQYYPGYLRTPMNPDGSGRSLGHEVVAMTVDFALGSFGDAWGRQIANSLDPNITNSWYRDGYFDPQQFAKAVGKQAWKIFTKNQGEDWAAALPYVYQMRWQRQMINRFSPGFKFLSDRTRAGWTVNKEGQIVGSFTPALALDFQLRFTGYNWYTLMYRDMYDEVADSIDDFRKEGARPQFHWPDDPVHAAIDSVAHTFRYILKSGIKAAIYMTPAVPFFWGTRVPQAKYKGVGYYVAPEANNYLERAESGLVMGPDNTPYNYFDHHDQVVNGGQVTLNNRTLTNSSFNKDFYPHGATASRGFLDKLLDRNGDLCYRAGNNTFKALQRLGLASTVAHREYVHDWVNASVSYTPYMIAKAETALRWDKPTMDAAIYRLIDGAASLQAGEVKGALSDIRDQIIHPPSPRKVAIAVKEENEKRQHIKEEEALIRKEMKDKKAGLLTDLPRPQVADIEHQQRGMDSQAKTVPPADAQSHNDWQYRTVTERFRKELEVPPGASVH